MTTQESDLVRMSHIDTVPPPRKLNKPCSVTLWFGKTISAVFSRNKAATKRARSPAVVLEQISHTAGARPEHYLPNLRVNPLSHHSHSKGTANPD